LLKYAKDQQGASSDEIPDEAEPLKRKYLHVVDKGLGKKRVSTLSQKKVCWLVKSMLSSVLTTL
jgi:hypothetical protein